MTKYGGLGGLQGGRNMDSDDAFEIAVNAALGGRIRDDHDVACQLWSALANVTWHHVNGDTAAYSFRAAGDLVAAMRGEGNYMDWYCCGPYATISDEIRTAMAGEGWTPDIRPIVEIDHETIRPETE